MYTHVTNKDLKSLYNQLKASAKKRGIVFDINMNDLNDLSFPLTCPVLKIPLKFNHGSVKDDSYSIDRKDSSKGYTVDNIIVISYRANKLKSDATLEELRLLTEFYSEVESESLMI